MKKLESTILIGILIVLNVWLLYNNQQKNLIIEELHENSNSSSWNVETLDSTLIHIVNDRVLIPQNEIQLKVFFSDQGCQTCIQDEVNLLNEVYNLHPKKFNAYLITQKAPTYLTRMFGASFKYELISPEKDIFDVRYEFVNPIAVLVDSTGLVHRVHKAEVANKDKSEQFYNQVKNLFEELDTRRNKSR
ncbi:MAG: hypothetical protein ED557_13470 [Balneola sp.]|nr:MAG: hypothetical protein ED557_13470 [Balneola sp.]